MTKTGKIEYRSADMVSVNAESEKMCITNTGACLSTIIAQIEEKRTKRK